MNEIILTIALINKETGVPYVETRIFRFDLEYRSDALTEIDIKDIVNAINRVHRVIHHEQLKAKE